MITNGETQPLGTDKLVKFEKQPVEVQNFRTITYHFILFYIFFFGDRRPTG